MTDSSQPMLDKSVHVQTYDRQAQLNKLKKVDRNGQLKSLQNASVGSLKHVNILHDGSAPHPESAKMGSAPPPPPGPAPKLDEL